MDTDSRYRLKLPDGCTITVNRINTQPGMIFSDVGGWRRVYGYTVRSHTGDIVIRERTLYGPVGAYCDRYAPTARQMTATLLSFLYDTAEHYQHAGMGIDSEYGAYVPWLSPDADEWCYMHADELTMAQFELTA